MSLDTANWTGFIGPALCASNKVRPLLRVVRVVILGLLCSGMPSAFSSPDTDRATDDSTKGSGFHAEGCVDYWKH